MDEPQLRYAEGPTTEAEVVIAAPPERVWAYVCDITTPARFSTEFHGASWMDGATAAAVGARFVGHNQHPAAGSWETTSTVTELEPNTVMAWRVGDVTLPSAEWRFTLTAVGQGTRLQQWMRIGPGRSGLSPAIDAMPDKEHKIIVRRLGEHHTNMQATLNGIRDLVEADNPPATF